MRVNKMTPPLLTISNAGVNLGDRWLFRGADLSLHTGDRLVLVGPNGAGKSTLMKLLLGHSDMDEGSIWISPGAEIAYLPQAPQIAAGQTLRSLVTAGVDDTGFGHKADAMLMQMGLDPMRVSDGLSGGEARRVSLARALYTKPHILLLDEPTNHMDLPTIEWIEDMLRQHHGALLVVSHDRAFLRNLGTGIIWLHDGKLRRRDGHFDEFESWSDGILTEEALVLHKMDRRIASETKWSREGISARRKRNQGRLRELKSLRAERSRAGGMNQRTMRMETGPADGGGRLVLEAINLCASVPATHPNPAKAGTKHERKKRRALLQDFNLLVRRSDRIGIVGPNGVGKSTLVRLLLDIVKPDSGRVRHGFDLMPAYFDQRRETLDRDSSPWTTLSDGGSDMIEVAGQTKHVTSYLRDFMFDEIKMTQRVSTLSGGEQNRLLLAKLFAQSHNFLVLDEPTNDLDIFAMAVLEEYLRNFKGCLIVVSHDRYFMDKMVDHLLVFQGNGEVKDILGNYTDFRKQEKQIQKGKKSSNQNKEAQSKNSPTSQVKTKLSFKEKEEFKQLEMDLEQLEIEKLELSQGLSDESKSNADLYDMGKRLGEVVELIDQKTNRWMELAEFG